MKRRYFWYFLLLLLPPVILSFVLNMNAPYNCIAGEPKDWIAFWGNYSGGIFSGVISFVIIFLSLEDAHKENTRILKHNHQENQTIIAENKKETDRILQHNHQENLDVMNNNKKETDRILEATKSENTRIINANFKLNETTLESNHDENQDAIRNATIDTCRVLSDNQAENKKQREYQDFLELKRNIATRYARLDIVKYVGAVTKPKDMLVLKTEIDKLNKWHEEIIIDVNSFVILYTGDYEDMIAEYKNVADKYLSNIASLIILYQDLQNGGDDAYIKQQLKVISDFIVSLKKLADDRNRLWEFTQKILLEKRESILNS